MPKRKRKKEEDESSSKEQVKDKIYKGYQKIGSGRYQAKISIDGKVIGLGTYDTTKEAAQAYDRAAIQAGRPISKLNFQDQVPLNYTPKKTKLLCNNTIGYRGVGVKRRRFTAQIFMNGRLHHLGMFDTTKDAAIAYDLAAIEAKRPTSDLNFPDMIDAKKKKKKKMKMKKKKKVVIKKKIKIKKSSTSTKSGSSSSSSSSLHILATLSGHVSRKFQEKY